MKHLLIITAVVISLLFNSACSDSSTGTADDGGTLTIDLNIHLMESDRSDNLTATLSDDEIDLLIRGVNEIWSQASIQWRVSDISRVEALNAEEFERTMNGERPPSPAVFRSVIPAQSTSPAEWDLFVIHDLGGVVGGIYFPQQAAILQPEVDPSRQALFEGGLIRITAHELGHSLSLGHVPCESPGNLMAPGCRVGDRALLNDEQIENARSVARDGAPYDGD